MTLPATRERKHRVEAPPNPSRTGRRLPKVGPEAPLVVLVAIGLLAFPFLVSSPFWQNVGILALTFGIAAIGWNLIGGFTGQVSFGHAVFFAAGAYAVALLVRTGWSPWPAMAVGAVSAATISVLIGFPTFRLRGHYFAIATIAAAGVARAVVDNSEWLGAARGLTIPIAAENGLWTLQFSIRDKTTYYLVALGLFAAASLVAWLLVRGKPGSYFQAVRDDQEAAAAAGIPVRRYKQYAFAASAALTSVAGGFYAMYVGFVDPPSTLSLSLSITVALIAVLGGAGALWGPLLGAWALTVLQELSRTELSGSGQAADLVLFGLAIVAVALFEPGGLVGLAARVRGAAARRFRRNVPGAAP